MSDGGPTSAVGGGTTGPLNLTQSAIGGAGPAGETAATHRAR